MRETAAAQDKAPSGSDVFTAAYGFVPNVFSEQAALPRVIEVEAGMIETILLRDGSLAREQKERILYEVACAAENEYCRLLFARSSAALSHEHAAICDFVVKLTQFAPWISKPDIEALRKAGPSDDQILETIQVVAFGRWLCTLAGALQPELDPGAPELEAPRRTAAGDPPREWSPAEEPLLLCRGQLFADLQPFSSLRDQLGFVPNFFKAQMSRPAVVQAEVRALENILFPEDALSRIQKERILVRMSAANANTYFVAVHRQVLEALGVQAEDSDRMIEDHHQAGLSPADVALLDEVLKLACYRRGNEGGFDSGALKANGFSEAQVIEAVAMAALTNFVNTLQAGIGAIPDFAPRRIFSPKDLYPSAGETRPTSDAALPEDPDHPLVVRVQTGDTAAFEELVRRHTRRVFGVLIGLVGNPDDARDVVQETFLKAFENIGRFQGRAKFSTWLMSIAVNTGTEQLRRRRPSESLDETGEDEGFRPRQVQSWAQNPEELLSASQRSELVRKEVLRLPQKYRVAVLLRDINQLSTEEAAAALGLSIPATKARLLRGRLMLRESLAPYFASAEKGIR